MCAASVSLLAFHIQRCRENGCNLLFHISILNEHKWPTVKQLIQLRNFGHFLFPRSVRHCAMYDICLISLIVCCFGWMSVYSLQTAGFQDSFCEMEQNHVAEKLSNCYKEDETVFDLKFYNTIFKTWSVTYKLLPALFQSLPFTCSHSISLFVFAFAREYSLLNTFSSANFWLVTYY